MHVIYHCVNGCNCSATAAAIHLDLLPMETKPSYHGLTSIPFYNNLLDIDKGKIIYRGTDENGNKIYTFCREYVPHIVFPAILDLWEAMGGHKNEVLLVNTQYSENRSMKLSTLMSKKLNSSNLGESLAVRGTLQNYQKIADIVKETKQSLLN